jgi:sugar transferase (PEP-CTERM system associated)
MWAILALVVSLTILTPSIRGIALEFDLWLVIVGFLLITVLPSVVVWSAFALKRLKAKVPTALCCQTLVTTLSMVIFYLLDAERDISGGQTKIVLLGLSVFAGLKISELLFVRLYRALMGTGQRVLVVGDGLQAELLEEFVTASHGRYVFLGRIRCPSIRNMHAARDDLDLETVKPGRFLRLAQNFMADKVVVSLAERRGIFPVEELLNCKLAGIEVVDAPSFYEMATHKLLIENITPSWFIFSHGFKVTWFLRLCKRIVDLCASLAGLIFFLPFIPFIVLAIKLDSPGPVLFRQTRVGEGDRNFVLMKFRSMCQDAEAGTGAVWSKENDPRITKVGNFLRHTRLDEIPQLVNILRGDMSLVGPRPERPEFVKELKARIPYYSERHYVKPGLTGWAQVSYPYGSSVEDAIEKLRFDLYYIKNISLFLDIYIIFKTFSVVLLGKGR